MKTNEKSTINWYPGHMAKARRQMEDELKLVDTVVEILDSRMPLFSRNPMLEELGKNKKKLIILNKADLSDPKENEKWVNYFNKEGSCLLCDSLNEKITTKVVNEIKEINKDKLDKAKARGIRKKVLRAMIAGIPNVGKSTFINNIVKRKVAKTENRPGVTKNLQWIRINDDVEFLDTPGILWPRIDDSNVGLTLGLLGSINDEILDKEELVNYGLNYLVTNYPGVLNQKYGVNESSKNLLLDIGKAKKCLTTSGEVDINKTISLILKDIRNNNLGKITWHVFNK